MSHSECGTAGHAETSRWAKRLGTVGLLQVVAKRFVAPIGRTKNLPDVSGQSVNFSYDGSHRWKRSSLAKIIHDLLSQVFFTGVLHRCSSQVFFTGVLHRCSSVELWTEVGLLHKLSHRIRGVETPTFRPGEAAPRPSHTCTRPHVGAAGTSSSECLARPLAVLILHEPVARTASRPTETPALTLLPGTTARTRSPVRKPSTTLVAFAFLSGNPAA
jgi:hypothetical protein